MTIIDCYKDGVKQTEVDTGEMTQEEVEELLELQTYLNRVCKKRDEPKERKHRIRFTK